LSGEPGWAPGGWGFVWTPGWGIKAVVGKSASSDSDKLGAKIGEGGELPYFEKKGPKNAILGGFFYI